MNAYHEKGPTVLNSRVNRIINNKIETAIENGFIKRIGVSDYVVDTHFYRRPLTSTFLRRFLRNICAKASISIYKFRFGLIQLSISAFGRMNGNPSNGQ